MSPLPTGSFISELGEIAGVATLFILAGLGVVAAIGYAVNKALQEAVKKTRETIYAERKTAVPALFTLIGAAGAAATNAVVAPLVGSLVAIVLAVIAFVATSLADDFRQDKLAFKISIAGCVVPVLAFTIAVLASAGFEHANFAKKALVIGAMLIVWIGVGWALVFQREGPLSDSASGTQIPS